MPSGCKDVHRRVVLWTAILICHHKTWQKQSTNTSHFLTFSRQKFRVHHLKVMRVEFSALHELLMQSHK